MIDKTSRRVQTRVSLARRLWTAQVAVLAVGSAALLVTALVVAPRLFDDHLSGAGDSDSAVREHAQEAFTSAFATSLVSGIVAALLAAAVLSWVLARRLARPVIALADAADDLATGARDVHVPTGSFAVEVDRLAEAFERMAVRLADTDASRTRLLSDLAHEIRNPLATLEAHIDGLEDGVVANGPEASAVMRHQVLRLRRLTEDLTDVAAADEHALSVRIEPTDLSEVSRRIASEVRPRFRAEDVELFSDIAPSVHVAGDATRLSQVLANVLDNALRHTPSGGEVTLRVEAVGAEAVFTVSDTGVGMSAEGLSHAFDRFWTGDASRSQSRSQGAGSGLGLTIVAAIVTAHGGTVQIDSPGPGEGSIVTVVLPAVDRRCGSSSVPSKASAAAPAPSGDPLRTVGRAQPQS